MLQLRCIRRSAIHRVKCNDVTEYEINGACERYKSIRSKIVIDNSQIEKVNHCNYLGDLTPNSYGRDFEMNISEYTICLRIAVL